MQNIGVVPFRLGFQPADLDEQRRQAIDDRENEGNMLPAGLRSIAQAPDQRFGSVGEATDARQAQKAGAALDRVDVPKQAGDQRRVAGVFLDAHELHRRGVDVFGRLREKFGK